MRLFGDEEEDERYEDRESGDEKRRQQIGQEIFFGRVCGQVTILLGSDKGGFKAIS